MEETEAKLRAEITRLEDANTVLEERIKLLQEQLDRPVICNRCGNNAANHPPTVDPLVVEEYFRSVLGQRPFTYTYKLMNNTLLLEFTSQFGTDTRELDRVVIDAIENGKAVSDIKAEELMLVTALSGIQVYDKENTKMITLYEADAETRKKYAADPEAGLNAIVGKLDRMTYQLVRRTFQKFVTLCSLLVQASEDENFFAGVGLL